MVLDKIPVKWNGNAATVAGILLRIYWVRKVKFRPKVLGMFKLQWIYVKDVSKVHAGLFVWVWGSWTLKAFDLRQRVVLKWTAHQCTPKSRWL